MNIGNSPNLQNQNQRICPHHEGIFHDRICVSEICQNLQIIICVECIDQHNGQFRRIDQVIEEISKCSNSIFGSAMEYAEIPQLVAKRVQDKFKEVTARLNTALQYKKQMLFQSFQNSNILGKIQPLLDDIKTFTNLTYDQIYSDSKLQKDLVKILVQQNKTSQIKFPNLDAINQKLKLYSLLIDQNLKEEIQEYIDQITSNFILDIESTPDFDLNSYFSAQLFLNEQQKDNDKLNSVGDCVKHQKPISLFCFQQDCSREKREMCLNCVVDQEHEACISQQKVVEQSDLETKFKIIREKYEQKVQIIQQKQFKDYRNKLGLKLRDLKKETNVKLLKFEDNLQEIIPLNSIENGVLQIKNLLNKILSKNYKQFSSSTDVQDNIQKQSLDLLNSAGMEQIEVIENILRQIEKSDNEFKHLNLEIFQNFVDTEAQKLLQRLDFVNLKFSQKEKNIANYHLAAAENKQIEQRFRVCFEIAFENFKFLAAREQEVKNEWESRKQDFKNYMNFIDILQKKFFNYTLRTPISQRIENILGQFQIFLSNLENRKDFPTEQQYLDELTKTKQKYQELKLKYENLQKDLELKQNQIVQFEKEIKESQNQIILIQKEKQSNSENIKKEFQKMIDKLQIELSSKQSSFETLEKQLKDTSNQVAELLKEKQTYRLTIENGKKNQLESEKIIEQLNSSKQKTYEQEQLMQNSIQSVVPQISPQPELQQSNQNQILQLDQGIQYSKEFEIV